MTAKSVKFTYRGNFHAYGNLIKIQYFGNLHVVSHDIITAYHITIWNFCIAIVRCHLHNYNLTFRHFKKYVTMHSINGMYIKHAYMLMYVVWCYSYYYQRILGIIDNVYWESFMEKNICEFRRFWNDRECFLATILYFVIILTKNVHCWYIATAIWLHCLNISNVKRVKTTWSGLMVLKAKW